MTLSSEIAALTGDESWPTLRAIDARVAVLLGLVPADATLKDDFEPGSFYSISKSRDLTLWTAPAFTTSLDATLAEIRRRGWRVCIDDHFGLAMAIINGETGEMAEVERKDDNLALAALEALVRAMEGQGE